MPLNHMPLVIKSKKLIHIYLWIRVHEKGTAKQKEMLEAKVEDGLSNLHQPFDFTVIYENDRYV